MVQGCVALHHFESGACFVEILTQLKKLLTEYVATVDELIRKRKPGEGILGMGNGPQDHPCHGQFDEQVQALIAQAVSSTLSAEKAMQIVSCLLDSEDMGHGVQCAQLMLIAMQRHCLPLIPKLSAADAKKLLDGYCSRYTVFKRFPAQKEIIKALKQQAR